MIFDDHKDMCITCSKSLRSSKGLERNEIIWCNEFDVIEPGYYCCEKFISKFSAYNFFWNEVF